MLLVLFWGPGTLQMAAATSIQPFFDQSGSSILNHFVMEVASEQLK